MAQALVDFRMPRSWRGKVEVSSAGTAAVDRMPPAPKAVAVLAERGIDLSRHRSRGITAEMIKDSDLVIAMQEAHREEILALAPGSETKVIVFGELEPGRDDPEVVDPIGGDEKTYRGTREELERLVALLIDYLIEKFELSR